MTTNNIMWSLGTCPNNSLNHVESSVPPQPTSGPTISETNGRSTAVQPAVQTAIPTIQEIDSAQYTPFSRNNHEAHDTSNSFPANDNDSKNASAQSEKIDDIARNASSSSQVPAPEADPTAHSSAQSRLLLRILDELAGAKGSTPLSINHSGIDSSLPDIARTELPELPLPVQPVPGSHLPEPTSRPIPATIPAKVTDRKFRAQSFASNLTAAQRGILFGWLSDTELTLADIQRRIAAPAPEGLGQRVHHSAIRRLRAMLENQSLQHWVDEAMDAACDLFETGDPAEVSLLRDSLIRILYSQALQKTRHGFHSREIHQCVAAIERLEKMRSRSTLASSPVTPAARVHVKVKVQHAQPSRKRRTNLLREPTPPLNPAPLAAT